MISLKDCNFYIIIDNLELVCEVIINFYRVYYFSCYVGEKFVICFKLEFLEKDVDFLN